MKKKSFKKPPFEVWLEKQKTAKAKRALRNLRKPLSFDEAILKARKLIKRGSMVKPIPLKMREELAEDKFMKTCCLLSLECKGRIEFHHNLIYAGKRINEYGAILPVCHYHHEKESKFKKQLNRIMEFRMTREEKDKYPRRKWL